MRKNSIAHYYYITISTTKTINTNDATGNSNDSFWDYCQPYRRLPQE